MKQVSVDNLKENDILAFPILSHSGTVLIHADVALTEELIERAINLGVRTVYIKDEKEGIVRENTSDSDTAREEEEYPYRLEETANNSRQIVKKILEKHPYSIYEGKEYHMTQHGFARDMEFSLVMKDNSAVVMKLESDENTKAVYPFDFELKITHRLADNNVITIWEVVNKDNKEMYFSIGGHPAFVCGENAIGAQVRFETKENGIQYHLLSKDGLVQPDIHYMPITNKNVTLTENFFDKDAYIIENSDIKCVSLCKDCKPVVEVIFDTPVFGLWSSAGKGVPFVCIEPWYGRADAVDFNCRLTDREWGNKLAVGKVFSGGYKMRFM